MGEGSEMGGERGGSMRGVRDWDDTGRRWERGQRWVVREVGGGRGVSGWGCERWERGERSGVKDERGRR